MPRKNSPIEDGREPTRSLQSEDSGGIVAAAAAPSRPTVVRTQYREVTQPVAPAAEDANPEARGLVVGSDSFRLNGKTFRLFGGAMHYFRIPAEYWRDRLLKLKALGCNTVETYVAWNAHEPRKGEFRFDGMLDIE